MEDISIGTYLRMALFGFAVGLSLPAAAADFSGEVSIEATIPRAGDFLGFGFDSLWMMSGIELLRINPSDNSVTEIPVEGAVGRYRGIAIGEDAVWVPDTGNDTIYKIDPQKNQVILKIPAQLSDSEGSIGVGADSVWAVTGFDSKQLTRFDAQTGSELAKLELPAGSAAVIFDFDAVWVTGSIDNELYRIDPATNLIADTIPLHSSPRFLTSGNGSVWVLNQGDGTIQRLDGKTGELVGTIEAKAAGGGGDIAFGGGFVWATTRGVPVIKIDPVANTLQGKFNRPKTVAMGDAIRYGAGSLWVSGNKIFRIKPP
jgi:streptogramin lyase